MTIIEVTHQLVRHDASTRIFAVASPSNSAADLIAEWLAASELNARELFRLVAPTRSKIALPAALLLFMRTNSEGIFSVPVKSDLMQLHLVVSACVSASIPHGIGVPRSYFSHVASTRLARLASQRS